MAKTGAGQMPHLGMQGGLDAEGLKLVFDWIRSLGEVDSGVADRTTEVLNEIERIRNQTHAGDMQAAIHSLGQHLTGVLGLAHAMDRGWLDERQKEMVGKLYRELNDPVRRDVLRRFFESSSNRMDALDVTLLDTLKPDIENGRRMFFEDASLQCGTCHKVNGKGGDLGPDLGRVAEKYTQSEALKHILQPSLVVEPEFGVISIETQNGLLLTGVLQQENEQGLVLMDVLGQKHQIDPATIIDRQRSSLSAMPEGLLTGRKPQEVVDLLGFLGYDRKN
jgi:putative heme-binding domain-containing protein